ncbi:hypothetical protein QBC39DRAFT_265170 [Podospora conica]|nr:hypothetical protein QBC39DRAFT_265170 [Schizothecium conicum]
MDRLGQRIHHFFFTHLTHLLPGHRRKLPVSDQAQCTLTLPLDVLILIVDNLPPESVISFALTCRVFFVQFFPESNPHLSDAAREALLVFLERDMPSVYFCHSCTHLHKWKRLQRPRAFSSLQNKLRYAWVRVAMNRHFHGPLHGPLLEAVGGMYCKRNITVRWTAKIRNDSLYISSTFVVVPPRKWGRPLKNKEDVRVDKFYRPRPCQHLDREKIPELVEARSSRFICPTAGKLRSCPLCWTDYRISIAWKDVPVLPYIEVVTWRKLGECRSPYDPEWENRENHFTASVSAPRRDVCASGAVYEAWMEDELCPAWAVADMKEVKFATPAEGLSRDLK